MTAGGSDEKGGGSKARGDKADLTTGGGDALIGRGDSMGDGDDIVAGRHDASLSINAVATGCNTDARVSTCIYLDIASL